MKIWIYEHLKTNSVQEDFAAVILSSICSGNYLQEGGHVWFPFNVFELHKHSLKFSDIYFSI